MDGGPLTAKTKVANAKQQKIIPKVFMMTSTLFFSRKGRCECWIYSAVRPIAMNAGN